MTTIFARRPAMRTLFEIVLVGDDASRLRSLAEDALDEVERVERLLSRFDPAAEVYRLNRSRGDWMRVDQELFDVLESVVALRSITDGWFEPFLVSGTRGGPDQPLRFDADRRAVQFVVADLEVDLGAFGKGYALDQVRRMLDRAGAENWLLSGGGSSVAASGCREEGGPWIVGLEDPFADDADPRRHAVEFPLENLSLSTSSVLHAGASGGIASDLFDPKNGRPLVEPASSSVLHASAAAAEAWSTALLAAGRDRAEALLDRARRADEEMEGGAAPSRVYWIARRDGAAVVENLSGEGHALADRSA
jgi:thiamine biosynthesis lipoprotein